MINAINTQTQSSFGMPASARVRTAWTRALPITMGEAVLAMGVGVDVQGSGVSKHRIFRTNSTAPGTSVWSPPT